LPHPLSQGSIGSPFIELQSVDSTNNYALERVHAGLASHGAAFFSHEQVAGKGQRGKTWVAEKNSSLILSVVIKPAALSLTQLFQLSACAAVSIYEFFCQYAGDETTIKWPNDLYWQDRKAGGVLIENVVGGGQQSAVGSGQSTVSRQQSAPSSVIGNQSSTQWQWAVIGMGININQPAFDPGLKNPVSLRQITGREFETMALAKELCFILEKNYRDLVEKGFDQIYRAYNDHLYKKGQSVRFRKGSRSFEATVQKVTDQGTLLVQHTIEEEFKWGEVEWII
jgi:BirA family biotin operon repressor/biotin-[acetyl-CoA-carboxylase] ligase